MLTQVFCSSAQLLYKEEYIIKGASLRCKYPIWAINSVQMKSNHKSSTTRTQNNINIKHNTNSNIHILVPYTKGLSESFKNIFGKIGFQIYFKGCNTIQNLLMIPWTRIISHRKEVITGISVTGWSVMWTTYGNLQGPFGKGSRNISGPLL